MKTIGIVGGTGFVGTYLSDMLVAKGYQIIIFTRNTSQRPKEGVKYAHWDPYKQLCDEAAISQLDAAVHLAGAGVADQRWTDARKKEIVDSRVKSTDFLLSQLTKNAPRCNTFVAASATGFYGPYTDGQAPFTESAPAHHDFLGETCRQWEEASNKAAGHIRTTILRIGIVLGAESGAFREFVKPMKFGIAPILGGGRQMVSWIEVTDLARLFVYALEHTTISGIYNAVAPQPVTHKVLMQTIAGIMGGVRIPVPAPALVLKIMLGELSIEVLKSCNVSDNKILYAG